MSYRIRLKPSAEKDLAKIPQRDRERIFAELAGLTTNPYIGKKLSGKYKGRYSIQVWPYRIIYQIYKKELLIIVIRIGHRQGVYQ
ncbi:type II toxin-antitoxin system RelE/ParE family toxin [Patescibacteria group bacterium AH-259-L05]|nr:type II toxin-antitoxin system RelE/ParE family toxin [Patescibacteria group bacterium AH-259-L05]